MMERLIETLLLLTHELRADREQREKAFEIKRSLECIEGKLDLVLLREKQIMATQAEVDAALSKIDTATNKLAANVQVIADTDQKISDEIDTFLAAAPAGTVLTQAQVDQLAAIGTKAQATSDASDAQVAVLQAIAAKGAGNPVPVPVPTPPVV